MPTADIVHHYIHMMKQKRELETRVNALKKNLSTLQDKVVDYFITEDIQHVATKDGTAYLAVDVFASLIADPDGEYDSAYKALAEANLDYLIKRGVNSQSLAAYVRQQRDVDEPIPPEVVPFIKITEKPRVGVKS